MTIEADTPYSPGWWLKILATKLQDRRNGGHGRWRYSTSGVHPTRTRPGIDLLDDYFTGDPPLTQVADEYQDFVRSFIRTGRLNLADLIVSHPAHRMRLRDFRTSSAQDEAGDKEVRDLMRRNDMWSKVDEVHEWFLAHGDSYGIVTPPDDFRDHSLFTAESAQQVITAHDAATDTMLAGLKMFRDDWDVNDFAYVFFYDDYSGGLPSGKPQLRVATKRGATSISDKQWRLIASSWDWDKDRSDQDLGKVGDPLPIVRWKNRKGKGEYEEHLSTLDRINDKIANEWWIIKMQAFRQRAIKNLPDTDQDGKKLTPEDWAKVFVADPGGLWTVPEDVDFWESKPTDITPVTNAIKEDLERLAATTQTALHTLLPDAENQSAVGASAKREEATFKVLNRRSRASGPWVRAMSLMLSYSNDSDLQKRANVAELEPIWGPTEIYSLSEMADADSKVKTLPAEEVWTRVWQYSPAEVEQLRVRRGRELIFQQAAQPLTTQPAGAPPQNGNQPGRAVPPRQAPRPPAGARP